MCARACGWSSNRDFCRNFRSHAKIYLEMYEKSETKTYEYNSTGTIDAGKWQVVDLTKQFERTALPTRLAWLWGQNGQSTSYVELRQEFYQKSQAATPNMDTTLRSESLDS